MNYKQVLLACLVLLAVAVGPARVAAQTQTTGELAGTVTDPSGAVIQDAKVALKSVQKGSTQETKTNASGVYRFPLLQPGTYGVTVTASGFQTVKRDAIVDLGQITTADFQLTLGAATQTVTVTEAAPLVQSENGDVASTITELQVQQLPNPGNDLTYIVQMAPGVVMNTQAGYGNFVANGLPGNSHLFTVNGMDNNDPYLNLNNSGATNLMLGQNEVQEVTVTVNGYSGQYGGLAGANVNYVTRSGGNPFHGRAIYWWSGSAVNANDWLNNAGGVPKPKEVGNQWAADFGGPIKKDKLFFYVNTEGIRVGFSTTPQPVIIPTLAFEQATINNLNARGMTTSAQLYQNSIFPIYNNAPGASRAVPGNGDPTDPLGCSGFSDTASGLGITVPCARIYTTSLPNFAPEWVLTGRVDWNIGGKDRVFAHVGLDRGTQPTTTDPLNSIFNASSFQPQYTGQLHETHTFGAALVNDLIISGSWYGAIFKITDQAGALAAFSPGTLNFRDSAFTDINSNGFRFPQGRNVTQYQISDDVARIIGTHSLKFGLKFRRNDYTDFGFANRSVSPRARVLIGQFFNGIGRIERRFPSAKNNPFAYYSVGGYIEDGWRIRPNLTVTASLRLDHPSNPVCQKLCFARTAVPFNELTTDPTGTTIGYADTVVLGNKQGLLGLTNLEWQPRISFAWQPFGATHSTVVRGGVGIFYDAFQASALNGLAQNSPLSNRFNIRQTLAWVPGETVGGAVPGFNQYSASALFNQALLLGFATNLTEQQVVASLPAALQSRFVPPTYAGSDRFTNVPQYQKWSLEIQQGLWRNAAFSIGYVGNHGIHEALLNGALNAGVPGFTGLPATALDARYRQVTLTQTRGVSNYHGLVLWFRQRLTDGQFQVNYTFSRAMDEGTGLSLFNLDTNASITTIEDPNNVHRNYGPADWDARHYFSANYVYTFPFKRWVGGRGPSALLDGWQVSGTFFARSGLPFTATDGLTSFIFGLSGYNATLFANYAGNGVGDCSKLVGQGQPHLVVCLDPNKFSSPSSGFSNLGRNTFRGPKFFDADFSLMKRTKIPRWEKAELGIGVQAFNVFNHPNFDQPVQDISSPLFGQITTTVGSPTSIFGSFLGADQAPRIVEIKAQFTF